MSRKRVILFLCILVALMTPPLLLPGYPGHAMLAWWSYFLYVFIILVNAGLYLVQRLWLIDHFFVRGRIGVYLLLSTGFFILFLGVQYLAHARFVRYDPGDGVSVGDFLGLGVTVVTLMLLSVLQLVTIFLALAVSMSDEWRMAAFRYNEAEKNNRALSSSVEQLRGQVDSLKMADTGKDFISVKIDLVQRKLRLEDILYVKSDGDYIVIHLADGSSPMVLMTLKTLEKQLPYGRFCRIHRSYLVNVEKVDGMKGGKVLVADEALPLSDSCKAAFFELLSHKSITLR
jgi:hypothetical protein